MPILRFMPLLLLAASTAATAQSMNADAFLTRATALMARGPLALFSSDYRLLKREGEAARAALKLERKALVATGRPTFYCPPAKGSLSSTELIGGLKSIPLAERRAIDMKAAMRAVLARKYPCKA